jgi:hypothetical protein
LNADAAVGPIEEVAARAVVKEVVAKGIRDCDRPAERLPQRVERDGGCLRLRPGSSGFDIGIRGRLRGLRGIAGMEFGVNAGLASARLSR